MSQLNLIAEQQAKEITQIKVLLLSSLSCLYLHSSFKPCDSDFSLPTSLREMSYRTKFVVYKVIWTVYTSRLLLLLLLLLFINVN